ncbi:MAG: cytochrome c3 family protein [Nitrospirae bacterium]|nr:cytochrome c3 family protein [Nitrospirota bacterium]
MRRFLLLTVLFSMLYASSAYAMITMSRHNLSSSHVEVAESTPYADVYTSGTSEVCVFCHTPHGGTTDAPLWNRALATAGTYTPYTSTTMDAPTGQPGGISLACLSCHDGTIALDAIRNAPGSGNFSTTPTSQGWTFNGLPNSPTDNTMPEGAGNRWITNLTQNLSDDHPISIRYANYGGTTLDPQFNIPGGSSSTALWFEETANTRADDNEVKLYPTGGVFMVECASCHNPHGTTAEFGTPANQLAPNGRDYATFLRKSNAASALCTTCHIK